jgi:hypothetical protein
MPLTSIPLFGSLRSGAAALLLAELPGSAVGPHDPIPLALASLVSALLALALWICWSAFRRTP